MHHINLSMLYVLYVDKYITAYFMYTKQPITLIIQYFSSSLCALHYGTICILHNSLENS